MPEMQVGAPRQVQYIAGSHWLAHEAAENITDDDSFRMGVKRWRREIPLSRPGKTTALPIPLLPTYLSV